MKLRILIAAFILCCITSAKAQFVTIPDSAFAAWLRIYGYSQCMTGDQLDTTCSKLFTLSTMDCGNRGIRSLEGLKYFKGLKILYCDHNLLTQLPQFPDSVYYLDCTFNQLTSLTTTPSRLTTLHCSYNQITSIPNYYWRLQVLFCAHNQLTSLPALPEGLTNLGCSENQITALPTLPSTLFNFYCNSNPITYMPPIPAGCRANINVSNTLITSMPALPSFVSTLQCNSTPIQHFTNIPDTIGSVFDISNTPNLYCLPKIGKVGTFYYDSSSLSCIPNRFIITSNPPHYFDDLPICGNFNDNGCPVYGNISGSTFFDIDSNCQYTYLDEPQRNIKHQLWQNGVLLEEVNAGIDEDYSFTVTSAGNYQVKIDTTDIPFELRCPSSGIRTVNMISADTAFRGNNFALRCKEGFDLAANSIMVGPLRPGIDGRFNLYAGDLANFYNTHCAWGIQGDVEVVISGPATYLSPVSGAIAPSSVNGDTVRWHVSDFGSIDANTGFSIIIRPDTFSQQGQQVCFAVKVTPIADNNSTNNMLTYCTAIVNSFDPNDKQVYPLANIDTAQEWMNYTVRFQNTGTAEAIHIYITDTLDQNLDASTFQLLNFSHQPSVEIKGQAVRFNFPNINLPDSNTNEAASHGYVQYKVKLKEGVQAGTTIDNTAFIYFDFNEPVVTNTVSNYMCAMERKTVQHNMCAGESYDFYGIELTQAGEYKHQSPNLNSCDSLITLYLNTIPSQATAISNSICAGETLDFYGTALTSAGNYSHTLQANSGCDSTINLTLTVNNVDVEVTESAETLTATNAAATYQWIDCNTQQPIANANAQSYTATASGSYAVVLSANNCTDTSACYSIIINGIGMAKDAFDFAVVPNPTKDVVHLYISLKGENTIRLYNTQGSLINETSSHTQANTIQLTDMANGVYYIEVQNGGHIARKRVIKL